MRFALWGLLFFSVTTLHAQTFSFPLKKMHCKASVAVCATLQSIQKQIPPEVTVLVVEIQGSTIIIKGHSPGYKWIGTFIENMTKNPNIKERMTIVSTNPFVGADKVRVEQFQLSGTLIPAANL
jgi:hypothetical protein